MRSNSLMIRSVVGATNIVALGDFALIRRTTFISIARSPIFAVGPERFTSINTGAMPPESFFIVANLVLYYKTYTLRGQRRATRNGAGARHLGSFGIPPLRGPWKASPIQSMIAQRAVRKRSRTGPVPVGEFRENGAGTGSQRGGDCS